MGYPERDIPLISTVEETDPAVGLLMITDCGCTVTLVLAVEDAPRLSETVAFTVYVPAVLY